MTDTAQMLDSSPATVPVGVAAVAAAVDACLECVQACTSCADADLLEADVEELRTCIALDQNCADVCDATARVLSRPGQWDAVVVYGLLQSCVRVCVACAEECAKHAAHHRHCAICERVCRACVASCEALLDDEAFVSFQRHLSS